MTFWQKGIFNVSDSTIFYQQKKIVFFSIVSNQIDTNLTCLGRIPSPIQLLVTIESPFTWKWAQKKILGLFPKTCFRWNSPLHESLKNVINFVLE